MKNNILKKQLLLCFLMSPSLFMAQNFSGGSGTEADPYQISSVGDLRRLSSDVSSGRNYNSNYFVLTNNINMDVVCEPKANGVEFEWNPIGTYSNSDPRPFMGFFDGLGHTISNLYCKSASIDFLGLFGYINGAKIQNLKLENVNLFGNGCIGGVCAFAESSVISNCVVSGNLSSKKTGPIGGVVGLLSNSSVMYCTNFCKITTNSETAYVGGVCGYSKYSKLYYNVNRGDVAGVRYVAGVCGKSFRGDFQFCISIGNIIGNSVVNGVSNDAPNFFSSFYHCYYDKLKCVKTQKDHPDTYGMIEGKLTVQMMGMAPQIILDSLSAVVKKWNYVEGDYPSLLQRRM